MVMMVMMMMMKLMTAIVVPVTRPRVSLHVINSSPDSALNFKRVYKVRSLLHVVGVGHGF